MTLPNFLIVGAAKSGTTALYRYLRQHPQVFMSPLKEPNYFAHAGKPPRFGGPRAEILNRDVIYQRDSYERLFRNVGNQTAIGEASPRYLAVPGTARRIKEEAPRMRLIAILRNPIERAFSSFVMYRRDGLEPAADLLQAIDEEPRRRRENWAFAVHLDKGFYAAHLREYYQFFSKSQMSVHLYDDFVREPKDMVRDVLEFIEVDSSFVPDMSVQHNPSGIIENPFLRYLWTGTHALRRAAPVLPKTVRQRVSRFFTSRPLIRMSLSDEARNRLAAIYRDDILDLQDLIGRDLSTWLR
jgi:Sulfotransferase family